MLQLIVELAVAEVTAGKLNHSTQPSHRVTRKSQNLENIEKVWRVQVFILTPRRKAQEIVITYILSTAGLKSPFTLTLDQMTILMNPGTIPQSMDKSTLMDTDITFITTHMATMSILSTQEKNGMRQS
mgnify:CR=1 FL=1